jgi:hypothetical protein
MADTRRRTGTASRSAALAGGGVAIAAVVALAGCGSSSGDGDASAGGTAHSPTTSAAPSPSASSGEQSGTGDATAVQTALTTTSKADSARMTLDESVRAGGKDVAVHGSGVTSMKGSGADARGEFTVVTAGQKVEMRVVGSTLYEKLPPSAGTGKLTGGKPWIKVDTTKIPHGTGSMSHEAPDASGQLAYLDHPQRVTKVGSATIDGAPTTHYRVVVSPQALAASGVSAKPIPVDVWVDAQHRVRQEKLTAVMTAGSTASPSAGSSQSINLTMTLHLTDFGTPVHVTAPPAGQVTDATKQIAAAAKKGSSSTV